ncbi:GNAT family acetyltransferase [Companilactobacillus crustorum]|uniref:Acetyltransferase n=3 Tax=Companilactobacillus TaxID=2767879 RepID=A0A837RI37_9LACO|nr:GNAT family N-acetyltransferase [Companilactobacillus crustorum]KRK43132.1 hypothetical protein FD26_GL000151 [Companilactobacillus crustorum JCM 15951]KRO20791.1 hypothetical protein IV63_GL000254 [Companilactobacillus crustorum]GEO76145.1 GNAT family acetyltransferase [Companilactobacillus crustorum]
MNKYLLDENKFDDFYDLYLYSFNRQPSQQRKNVLKERYEQSLVYGIMNGKKLGSGLFSIPFEINFHGTNFRMNGIGDVMSAPEFGGRGGASTLLKTALTDMYHNQVTLSYLTPFSFGYYRQFGYEQVFDHTKITVKNNDLPRVSQTDQGYIERINIKDISDNLKKIYFENNHLGGLVRSKWWWDHMLDKHSNYQVALAFDNQRTLIGYLIYYTQEDKFIIHEWINMSPLSRQLLLKFVTKHQSIFSTFIYESPDADFKSDVLSNPYSARVEVIPYMMARIVNLKDFVSRYPVQKMQLAKIYFRVEDSLEWNQHTWALAINDGIVDFKIADGHKADLELDIQDLTKAMFGYRTLNSLAEYGRIKGEQDKISALNQIFVKNKPQLIDYF